MHSKNAAIDLAAVVRPPGFVLLLDKQLLIVYVLATIEVLLIRNPAFRIKHDSPHGGLSVESFS
jgi:hypothetical protein